MEKQERNVVKVDGKLFVKTIRRCHCDEKIGDTYIINCRIKERGEHTYTYQRGDEKITRYLSNRTLYLSEKAIKVLNDAIDEMENALIELKVNLDEPDRSEQQAFVYYRRVFDICDCIIDYIHNDERAFRYFKGERLKHLLFIAPCVSYSLGYNVCNDEIIAKNPFYIAAVKKDDVGMQKLLRILYGIASNEDCKFLSKLFGVRILPSLSKEYDKTYVVDADTINIPLLSRSGYRIAHRPYFSMQNSTHSLWELNPHQKTGVDASKIDTPSMAFCDYLALFDENEE